MNIRQQWEEYLYRGGVMPSLGADRKVQMPDGFEHVSDLDERDKPEANTKDGLIPDSWLDDNGIRHAVVWEEGTLERMRIEKINGEWRLVDEPVF